MKYLVVGLGNVGPEYLDTRHNIGFMVASRLAEKHGGSFSLKRLAFQSEIKYRGRQLVLIKPTTFMNLSGKAVNYWLKELGIRKDRMMVVVDDIALPFGALRMRPAGSSAGHNGLKDIEAYLGQDYPRLRFGVGDDFHKGFQADYVLSPFNREEQAGLSQRIDRACDMIESFVFRGLGPTMTEFND